MTHAKPLKNCTLSEIQAYIAIVRLAVELKENEAFPEPDDDAFDNPNPNEDLLDAIVQTVNLVYFASDIMEDSGGEPVGDN